MSKFTNRELALTAAVALVRVLLVCFFSVVSPTLAQDLCLAGDFEQQTKSLLNYIRMPEERVNQLTQVTSDIERVLQTQWPGSKVERYGSSVTGLTLKSSDVDCNVDIPDDKRDAKTLVADALDILKNYPHVFQQLQPIFMAHVPLLICVHVPTKTFVDITFFNCKAVKSSRLLSYILHLDKRALDLATIVKYWGSVHDIAHGNLTLPSYSMTLMTVFYLQQKNILPTVSALQQNVTSDEIAHWNMAFQPIEYHTENNETLYELLGGFFKYYSAFDFGNTVISPYVGYPISRTQFLDLDNLKNLSLYKHNVVNGFVEPFMFGHLNIQDTLIHNDNVGRPCTGKWLSERLMKQLGAAARMYEVLSSEEFLTALLVPEKRIEDGVLKTFWSGGVGSTEYCRRQQNVN